MLSERAKTWLGDFRKRREIARELHVTDSTVRGYIAGRLEPSPCSAAGMIRIAGREEVVLTYADFFGDPHTRTNQLRKELP